MSRGVHAVGRRPDGGTEAWSGGLSATGRLFSPVALHTKAEAITGRRPAVKAKLCRHIGKSPKEQPNKADTATPWPTPKKQAAQQVRLKLKPH